jgi:hypothetical protein
MGEQLFYIVDIYIYGNNNKKGIYLLHFRDKFFRAKALQCNFVRTLPILFLCCLNLVV